jgi:hypothetical protein
MKTICKLVALGLLITAIFDGSASAADPSVPARSPVPGGVDLSENLFSGWAPKWTNLTVKAPCPVGASPGIFIPARADSPAAQQALDKLLVVFQEDKRERLLRPQRSMADVYRVSLSRATNTVKIGP